MPTLDTLVLFAGTVVMFLLIPGPAVIYIVTRSASQGRRAGLVSVAGIHLGTLVHVAGAVLGLSAVLATSATAFTVVKLAGAAYLIQLGVRSVLRAGRRREGSDEPRSEVASPTRHRSLRQTLLDGAVVNILNPKTAVFFLAFVPQFVEVGAARPTVQLLALSAVFLALGALVDGSYAVIGGTLARRMSHSASGARFGARATGTVYIGLGLATAVSGSRHN